MVLLAVIGGGGLIGPLSVAGAILEGDRAVWCQCGVQQTE